MRVDRLPGLWMALLAFCFCPPPLAHAAPLVPRSGDVPVAKLAPEDWYLGCPDVAVGTDGAAVVVWGRFSFNDAAGFVLARRVEADGGLGPSIQVSDEYVGDWADGQQPGVVAMDSGGYFAHWTGGSTSPDRPAGTVLQFLDPGGNPMGARRLVNGFFAQVAAVGNQLAVVANRNLRRRGLWLRLLDRQGDDMDPPRQLTAGETYGYAVASDGAGGVVAAWTEARGRLRFEVRAQAFDGAGQPLSAPIVVSSLDSLGVSPPQVAARAGRFVVGWSLGAWFDWEGKRTTPSTSLPADEAHDQQCGRLAMNGRGDWAAAWDELGARAPFMTRTEARTFSGP